jgi:signal transduction histidine kinase
MGAHFATAALVQDDGELGQAGFAGLPRALTSSWGRHPLRPILLHTVDLAGGTLRLTEDADIAALGLPPGHPEITSFLGATLRRRGRAFGVVYLGESENGQPWTEEDEALMGSLGAAVGEALGTVDLLRDALKSRRWMRAATTMTRDVLSPRVDEPLRLISDRARELAEADIVALMLLDREQEPACVRIRYARGLHAQESLHGHDFSLDDSKWTERVIQTARGQVLANLPDAERDGFRAMSGVDIGPAMMLPLQGIESVFGTLFLGRISESPRFSQADAEIAGTFAHHAAMVLELASARQVAEQLHRLEDRQRIARDLHDHVIQRVYATGISLNRLGRSSDGEVSAGISAAVAALDETIRQIRSTILSLRSNEDNYVTLEKLVMDIAGEATPLLGFEPQVSLEAPAGEVTGRLAGDLAACVREGLSNVVRHAHADRVEIHASVDSSRMRLTLRDNGVGISSERRSGLLNLAERATEHGGTFELCSEPGDGTQLTWVVPFPGQRTATA